MSTSAAFFRAPLRGPLANGLVAGLRIEGLDGIRVGELQYRDEGTTLFHEVRIDEPIEVRLPGIDALWIAITGPATSQSTVADLVLQAEGAEASLGARAELRINADVLRPLKPGTDEPDPDAEFVAVSMAEARLELDTDGNLAFELDSSTSIPRCMIAETGVVIEVGSIRWLTPNSQNLPASTPAGFTGLALDDVAVTIPGLALGDAVTMDDVFLGTGGFHGRVGLEGLDLELTGTGATGELAGTLLGFHGGLVDLDLEFAQTQLVGCNIAGDVWIPYLDTAVGVQLGLTGQGGVTATVTEPHTTVAGQTADGYLVSVEVADAITFDVRSMQFAAGAGAAAVTIAADVTLDVDVLDAPKMGVTGMVIDSDGNVTIEGGWIELDEAVAAEVAGASFEITRIGCGTREDGRRFVAVDGGLQLAADLPIAASVEGLTVSWDPDADPVSGSVRVQLDGIGLEFKVPGVAEFAGEVSLADIDGLPAFRGHGKLSLPTLDFSIEANLVIGRDGNDTFFFLHVAADLPVGIPLFTTGAAIYGLAGLVAEDMGPDRDADTPWYSGWYRPEPTGVTHGTKWAPEQGTFAVGLGATIGTAPDNGFAFHARTLLVLLLPGPTIMLEGKGTLISKREDDSDPTFDAFMVLDVPGKRFEAGLGASYEIPVLYKAAGTVEAAFSWAANPPADLWHVYLGQEDPRDKRISATWLKVLTADAWFMAERNGLNLGAWAGIDEDKRFGPVRVTVDIGVGGKAEVSWNPAHFLGELELGGTVGVRVFGVGITLTARAEVLAQAPTPWHLRIELEAGIEVDLVIKTFRWSTTVVLEWKDQKAPEPLPRVARIALEHEVSREPLPATSGGVVPADVRPVIVFDRPTADPGRISPVVAQATPDRVGDAEIQYELSHLALQRDGNLTAVAGVASVAGTKLTVVGGPDLAGLAGADVVVGAETFTVTAATADTLTLDRTPSGGDQPSTGYRVTAAPASQDVIVNQVEDHPSGDLGITLDAAVSLDPVAGGTCTFDSDPDEALLLLEATGSTIICRRTGGARPQPGPAQLVAPRAPVLRGLWQVDHVTGMGDPTRLALHARTPFAWWRSNSDDTLRRLEDNGTACGINPQEEPTCLRINPALEAGPKDAVIILTTTGVARWKLDGDDQPELWLGTRADPGTVTLLFDPPIERFDIRLRELADEATAEVVSRRNGQITERLDVVNSRATIAGRTDRVDITGHQVAMSTYCIAPHWKTVSLVGHDPDERDRTELAGIVLTTTGSFNGDPGGLGAAALARPRHINLDGLPTPRLGRPVPFGRGLTELRPSVDLGFPTPVIDLQFTPGEVEVVAVLPQPCTRLRVHVGDIGGDGSATIEAIGPGGQRQTTTATADDVVELHATERCFSHLLLRAPEAVQLRSISWDEGDLGWRRAVHVQWTDSVGTVTDVLASEDDVLPPGSWQLNVLTRAIVRMAGTATTHTLDTVSVPIEIGPPPGLGAVDPRPDAAYPDAGPLATLGTFVAGTEPVAGAPVAYRSHDVRVAFTHSHISRMYAAAGAPLGVRVVDAVGGRARATEPVVWEGADHRVRRTEETWITSLENGNGCASVNSDLLHRDDAARFGIGGVLAPRSPHLAELVAGGRVVHAIPFVTSRFIDAAHHLVSHGRLRGSDAGPADVSAAVATDDGEGAGFDAAVAALSLPSRGTARDRLEITRLAQGFLFDSPEPLPIQRMQVTATHAAVNPRQRRRITFSADGLRPRDRGDFVHDGLALASDQPVRVRDGVLVSDGEGTWTLSMDTAAIGAVAIDIMLPPHGSATIASPGRPDQTVTGSPTARATRHRVELADVADSVSVSGERIHIEALSISEPVRLPADPGPLFVVDVTPPSRQGGDDHEVRVRAVADMDLTGVRVLWNDVEASDEDRLYHAFQGGSLAAGDVRVIRGGRSGGGISGGHADGTPPTEGFVVSVMLPDQRVSHRGCGIGQALFGSPAVLLPLASRDRSRLLLVSPSRQIAAGTWRLDVEVAMAGAGLATQSIGGDTRPLDARLVLPPPA